MRSSPICVLLSLVLFIFVTGCNNENAGNTKAAQIKIEKLKTHHTLKSNKNLLLGLPVKLKYDDKTDHLFILDVAKHEIIEINDSDDVVNKFGGKGHGPGEVQAIQNFYITSRHLFIVDGKQLLINKYRLRDGHYISSLDYGKFLLKNKVNASNHGNHPPPPPLPFADDNNKPFVTQKGTVLLPTQTGGKYLYEERNWKGKKLANIGAVPKGYAATEKKDKIRSALENGNVPQKDLAEAFPVNDCANPNDIYLVYSAIPKIAKYSLSGQKIWAHKISRTPEIDSIMTEVSNLVKKHHHLWRSRIYVAGRCSPDGNLYLATFTYGPLPFHHLPMWIHQFSPKGKLVKRYKIVSNIDLFTYPGIDFKRNKIFFPSVNHSSLRIYHF